MHCAQALGGLFHRRLTTRLRIHHPHNSQSTQKTHKKSITHKNNKETIKNSKKINFKLYPYISQPSQPSGGGETSLNPQLITHFSSVSTFHIFSTFQRDSHADLFASRLECRLQPPPARLRLSLSESGVE